MDGITAVGSRAPDFRLSDLDGGQTTLVDLLPAGPVLLAFFKISCPVCQLTFPFLGRIHRERAPASVVLYGISQDDATLTGDFRRRFGVTFPLLLDRSEKRYPVSNAYRLESVPTLFLVNRDGVISWRLEGFVKREIQALAGKFGVNPFRAGENVPEWKAG